MSQFQANILTNKENISEHNEDRLKAKILVDEAKILASEGELYKSLRYFQKAYNLFPSTKIASRIKRLEEAIRQDEEDEGEDFGFIELDNGLVIYKKLVERLYPHQIEGVKWIYDLYAAKKKGGILADDMGLGKTIQIISFISAMFDMKLIKNALIVLPLSVIPNWVEEFKSWAPGIRVECFCGSATKRKAALHQSMTKRSVCITTYGLVLTQFQTLSETLTGREFVWDYIILDEGHRIKNPSKTTKRLHCIPSRNRLILTGTPVQNRVRDLWALMDWVTQGSLLGTKKTFRAEYELPIERARQRDASAAEIQLGNHMAESLRKLTSPFVLRRTKEGLMIDNEENIPGAEKAVVPVDETQDKLAIKDQPSFPKLSTKNDFVVWVYLSDVQQKIYKDFIQLDSVKELLSSHRSPLVYLTVLKKICDHPRLLSNKACLQLGLESNNDSFSNIEDSNQAEDCAANRIDNISDDTLINESGKLQFLIELLLRLRKEGHRTLVFSMSRKMLNIIQRILLNKKFKIMRLDGLVTKLSEREKRVKLFQEDPSYNIFLLTTQVGGVGLTLTAADRVVIYDPSWNPATDAQAVDRIYRIGQKKSVAVYRLITCGSVEEKIYRRQIFKNSVIQQSTGGEKDPFRYFTRQDLAELFSLDDVTSSATQQQLERLHGHQRNLDEKLEEHIKFVHTLKMFGISDHDLMFSRKPDDFDYEEQMADERFNNKVVEAQNRLKVESVQFTGQDEAEQRWGAFVESKPKDGGQSNNVKNEPVYPIEGLSQRLDALSFPAANESAESSFSKLKTAESDDDDVITQSDSPSFVSSGRNTFADNELEKSSAEIDDSLVQSNSLRIVPGATVKEMGNELKESSGEIDGNDSALRSKSPTVSTDDIVTQNGEEPNYLQRSTAEDNLILARDSPIAGQQEKSYSANQSPLLNRKDKSTALEHSTFYDDDESDNLILAIDSPLPDLDKPSTEFSASHYEFPSEVQDSFTAFPDSDSEEDHDDSWKEAFSAQSSVPSLSLTNANGLTESPVNSPVAAPNRRYRPVIESEESDNEDLMQLHTSGRFSTGLSFNKRRSVNIGLNGSNPPLLRRSVSCDSDDFAKDEFSLNTENCTTSETSSFTGHSLNHIETKDNETAADLENLSGSYTRQLNNSSKVNSEDEHSDLDETRLSFDGGTDEPIDRDLDSNDEISHSDLSNASEVENSGFALSLSADYIDLSNDDF